MHIQNMPDKTLNLYLHGSVTDNVKTRIYIGVDYEGRIETVKDNVEESYPGAWSA